MASQRGKPKLGFNEIFDVMSEAGKLDLTFKRILFILARRKVVTGQEKDVLQFVSLDRKSLHRRLDLLVEKKLVEVQSMSPDKPTQEYRLKATTAPDRILPSEKVSPEETGFEYMHS